MAKPRDMLSLAFYWLVFPFAVIGPPQRIKIERREVVPVPRDGRLDGYAFVVGIASARVHCAK